jgi:hypothetical protein
MSHDLIRSWLGLPAEPWPPTHYQLLGLDPGENDIALIERRAQQRLDAVRCYQLAHPEQATEALNRLAQAYVCLTEPAAKRRYDESLGLDRAVALLAADKDATKLPCVATDTPPPGQLVRPRRVEQSPRPRTPTPPPLPALPPLPDANGDLPTQELVVPGISEESTEEMSDSAIEATLPPLVTPSEETGSCRVCPLEEAARSRVARVGLCTRRGILRRIQVLRQLVRAWNNVGRLLPSNTPNKKLNLKAQTLALVRNLKRVEELLEQFPPIFGQAGQPGFLVLSLPEQSLTTKKLQALDSAQRDKLREDWEAGYTLLRAHGRLLTELTEAYRGLGPVGRIIHALHTAMVHQPTVAIILWLLLAGNVLLWGWYAYRWCCGQALVP